MGFSTEYSAQNEAYNEYTPSRHLLAVMYHAYLPNAVLNRVRQVKSCTAARTHTKTECVHALTTCVLPSLPGEGEIEYSRIECEYEI